jgi:hypothetical protein
MGNWDFFSLPVDIALGRLVDSPHNLKPKLTINQTKLKKIGNLAKSRKWLDLGNIDPYNQPNQTENLEKSINAGRNFIINT